MATMSAISQQIWDLKYRLKPSENGPGDPTVEDTWRRIARALAVPEADPELWAGRFYDAMADFQFLPAGRIVAGAGTQRTVTLFNCFVMGSIPDDMGGIFAHLREAALTMQQGGGIGYDFSTLRPKGAPVKGVGADASGPLSFMDVWDAMCRTIMSAGYRRGAMMATLRCDHPDIEAFVEAKREPGRLRMFNLSVLATDAFMQAVKEGAPWELKFGGTTYKVIAARELWDKIMRATYGYAEPGIIFIDRINARNNLWYCEDIRATNPCVPADVWVDTSAGRRQVGDLIGMPFTAVIDGAAFASGPAGFFETGSKKLVRLRTIEGYTLRLTADHRVLCVAGRTRWRIETVWRPAGDLQAGDEILLNDPGDLVQWPGAHTEAEGYLIGLLIGDGTLKEDKAVLSVWKRSKTINGAAEADPADGIMAAALAAARTLPHRTDFGGWVPVQGRGEWRLSLASVRRLALELGLAPRNKAITPAIERASADFQRGLLRGLFDADGTVMGSQTKGVSVRLAQSDLDRLEAVQRMLLRFGIVSSLYRRRSAATASLPDGRGGMAAYPTAEQWELVIANENIGRYADRIGFCDLGKAGRLNALREGYRRIPNRERFLARVTTVEPAGEEAVYDVQIPDRHAFAANGIVAHNCGEQPLPPYGACLLGSINLARLVREPFSDAAALDEERLTDLTKLAVRMMDNTIDVSGFPLEPQAAEARLKRRIGLGVTGLADALIFCRARYGSAVAVQLTHRWMRILQRAAYEASVELAREKGAFPLFDRERFLEGAGIRELDEDLRAAIAAHGIRNALLTSIAPTGTISLFADNVSSGIEPVFAFSYTRNLLMPDGTRREEEVCDPAYHLFRRLHGEAAPLPDYFIDAQSLTPGDHVVMQAAVQRFIDSSISKTINVPADIGFDAFKTVYLEAYDQGCKGCTTYRPNEVTGAVLTVRKEATPEPAVTDPAPPPSEPVPADIYEAGGVVYMTQPLSRPEALPGQTYKVRWPESDHALYITLNDIVQDGRRRPFEVFINSKNMDHYAWTVALTRMISAVFRRGGDVSFVVDELKAVFDPRGGAWVDGKYRPSLLAVIGDVMERHMTAIGFLPGTDAAAVVVHERPDVATASGDSGRRPDPAPGFPTRLAQCPRCGNASMIRSEGCDHCTSCAYSKCG